jgi:RNA polymerase sigma factor (sigma-70 family)
MRLLEIEMTINNPLADNSPDHEDRNLVVSARSGDRTALEHLVQRHQTWIYNIAVRMLYHPQDAEDATQEILIKVLTRLSSFEGRSSFRTWLYRIVVNHVLNMKRGRAEVRHAGREDAYHSLNSNIQIEEVVVVP